MAGGLRKYLTFDEFRYQVKKIHRRIKSILLLRRRRGKASFTPIWNQNHTFPIKLIHDRPFEINVFGTKIDHMQIDWHKDYIGDFKFPLERMDRIKLSKYTNRGMDVKFPWELSRFVFALGLAVTYLATKDRAHYLRFKELVLDWSEKNPFLFGVNWLCTMDVGIRAINLIMAANVFKDEINSDLEFKILFSGLLTDHALYINAFPEIYKGKHTTNHTVAGFVALLFLARALPGHKESKHWQKKSVKWLNQCIYYQVYPDGGSFEASSGYHRLVTELFSLTFVLCGQHSIGLPTGFHYSLNSMFHFIHTLIDQNGNVPAYGDNDSSTLIQYGFSRIADYSYLKTFSTYLYNRKQLTTTECKENPYLALLPEEPNKELYLKSALNTVPQSYTAHKNSGIYILKSSYLSGTFYCIPPGLNGKGSHNHYDVGSFTLSFSGQPLIVDPGTYTYTGNFHLRNKFRAYTYHNTVIPEKMDTDVFTFDKIFELKEYFRLLDFSANEDNKVSFSYQIIGTKHPITRTFYMEERCLTVIDESPGEFQSNFHLAPTVLPVETGNSWIRTDKVLFELDDNQTFEMGTYDYAPSYYNKVSSKVITANAKSRSRLKVVLIADESH